MTDWLWAGWLGALLLVLVGLREEGDGHHLHLPRLHMPGTRGWLKHMGIWPPRWGR